MPPRTRIGLIGKAGSGKSSAAAFLAAELGFQHCRTGGLCRDVSRLVFGDEATSHLHAISDVLQTISEGLFLDAALRGVDPDRAIVIDAVRFDYDVAYARANGFALVRIKAADSTRRVRLERRGQAVDHVSADTHPIEVAMDRVEADFEIENDGKPSAMTARLWAIARGDAE